MRPLLATAPLLPPPASSPASTLTRRGAPWVGAGRPCRGMTGPWSTRTSPWSWPHRQQPSSQLVRATQRRRLCPSPLPSARDRPPPSRAQVPISRKGPLWRRLWTTSAARGWVSRPSRAVPPPPPAPPPQLPPPPPHPHPPPRKAARVAAVRQAVAPPHRPPPRTRRVARRRSSGGGAASARAARAATAASARAVRTCPGSEGRARCGRRAWVTVRVRVKGSG